MGTRRLRPPNPEGPVALPDAVAHGYRPVHLGKARRAPCTRVDRIPWTGRDVVVTFECREFTSLCPITGQPDFGTLRIVYAPDKWLIESKSLKLYLWQFRARGAFNEELVVGIADDLYRQVRPQWIEVAGHFQPRGGIALAACARRPAAPGAAAPVRAP